jgi:hypothetical protein
MTLIDRLKLVPLGSKISIYRENEWGTYRDKCTIINFHGNDVIEVKYWHRKITLTLKIDESVLDFKLGWNP